ncbi:hypothetical protein B4Q13_22045, partial [Lacticaseibacillus rhamnosus]
RFELAAGGTLFLDEIAELPLGLQAKLLRVLQSREFERVGGTETLRSDARIIAATNRNREELVQSGAFRQDLFYRLNVFPIEVPPLRERKDDLLMLVEYFVQRYAKRAGKNIRSIDGGLLVQDADTVNLDRSSWRVVTVAQSTDAQWADLRFAWQVCAAVSSNAIVYAIDGPAVGIGAGQQNRRGLARLAAGP